MYEPQPQPHQINTNEKPVATEYGTFPTAAHIPTPAELEAQPQRNKTWSGHSRTELLCIGGVVLYVVYFLGVPIFYVL
jgi:hypothetical protein